jgi:hypothetical protein
MERPSSECEDTEKGRLNEKKIENEDDDEAEAVWALQSRVSISSNDAALQLLKGAREGPSGGGAAGVHNALK